MGNTKQPSNCLPSDSERRTAQPRTQSVAIDLATAWATCGDLYSAFASPRVHSPSGAQFERELLFCLLGGFGVSFELAFSATERLVEVDPFNSSWNESDLLEQIRCELSRRQFEPRTANGTPRSYRFPNRKADLIVGARRWLLAQGAVSQALICVDSERERRRMLCDCPGIGLKTATWLLRNLGLASQLAILDIHVVRALRTAGRIASERLPRDYEAVEVAFLKWCAELGAPPAAFDLFVWEWQRGSLAFRA